MHQQHWPVAFVEKMLSAAAEDQFPDAAMAIAAHDKKIGVDLGRQTFETIGNRRG